MPNRVIILEGPDGSGKTTLATKLRDRFNFKIVKTGPPKRGENLLESYSLSLWQALRGWEPVVFDRHYLGELIYGPVMRGEDRLTEYGHALIERMIAAYGVQLFVCLPNGMEAGWARCQERGEKFITRKGQYAKIYDGYQREVTRLGAVTYMNDGDFVDIFYDLPPRVLPLGVTGSPLAETLILGERVNTRVTVLNQLPFHALTGCSPYLYESVRDAGLAEEKTAWANAYDAGNNPCDLKAVLTALPRLRRIIALGEAAGRVCERHLEGAPPGLYKLPHPQYWKRFQTKNRQAYVNLLHDALGGDR